MKTFKRIFGFVIALVMLCTVFTGCANKDPESITDEPQMSEQETNVTTSEPEETSVTTRETTTAEVTTTTEETTTVATTTEATTTTTHATTTETTTTEATTTEATTTTKATTTVVTTTTEATTTAKAEEPSSNNSDELTSLELSVLMGNGTNLGNTMEAVNVDRGNYTNDTSKYETQWGQPVTTQKILDGLKASGFDTVRIPVAWMTNATTLATNGDYTISKAYLDRVEQIIEYALNADMYVIVNDHWDGGWYGMFGSENEKTRKLAKEAYAGMWTQIAEAYKHFPSDRLIFEGANEEIGSRFDENSKLYCSDSEDSYLSHNDRYALANEVNQLFVDTIRATGGNNANRFLLIPGFGTNIDQTCDKLFVMPKDSAKDKLLISVHYYEPGSYTTAENPSEWGIKSHYEDMENALKKMTKFTKQGYGVVIGEYGAYATSDGKLKKNQVEYLEHFLDVCDYYDLTSCLWDCSNIFIRRELKMMHPDLANLYSNRNYESESDMTRKEVKAAARDRMDKKVENAPTTYNENAINLTGNNAAAWLMWISGDWNAINHPGNEYDPNDIAAGIKNTDVEITGAGTYTVGLDFTGTPVGYSNSIEFSAIGIANGEKLFPGYVIDIKEVVINGKIVKLTAVPYTTSDGNNCTRVNLYNAWITDAPNTTRTATGSSNGISPCVLDPNGPSMSRIETVYITFHYGPKKQ